jgi:hypothetical protein
VQKIPASRLAFVGLCSVLGILRGLEEHIFLSIQRTRGVAMIDAGLGAKWAVALFAYFAFDVTMLLAIIAIVRRLYSSGEGLPTVPFRWIAIDVVVIVFMFHLARLLYFEPVQEQLASVGFGNLYLLVLAVDFLLALFIVSRFSSMKKRVH